jgi:hypothetical protein
MFGSNACRFAFYVDRAVTKGRGEGCWGVTPLKTSFRKMKNLSANQKYSMNGLLQIIYCKSPKKMHVVKLWISVIFRPSMHLCQPTDIFHITSLLPSNEDVIWKISLGWHWQTKFFRRKVMRRIFNGEVKIMIKRQNKFLILPDNGNF